MYKKLLIILAVCSVPTLHTVQRKSPHDIFEHEFKPKVMAYQANQSDANRIALLDTYARLQHHPKWGPLAQRFAQVRGNFDIDAIGAIQEQPAPVTRTELVAVAPTPLAPLAPTPAYVPQRPVVQVPVVPTPPAPLSPHRPATPPPAVVVPEEEEEIEVLEPAIPTMTEEEMASKYATASTAEPFVPEFPEEEIMAAGEEPRYEGIDFTEAFDFAPAAEDNARIMAPSAPATPACPAAPAAKEPSASSMILPEEQDEILSEESMVEPQEEPEQAFSEQEMLEQFTKNKAGLSEEERRNNRKLNADLATIQEAINNVTTNYIESNIGEEGYLASRNLQQEFNTAFDALADAQSIASADQVDLVKAKGAELERVVRSALANYMPAFEAIYTQAAALKERVMLGVIQRQEYQNVETAIKELYRQLKALAKRFPKNYIDSVDRVLQEIKKHLAADKQEMAMLAERVHEMRSEMADLKNTPELPAMLAGQVKRFNAIKGKFPADNPQMMQIARDLRYIDNYQRQGAHYAEQQEKLSSSLDKFLNRIAMLEKKFVDLDSRQRALSQRDQDTFREVYEAAHKMMQDDVAPSSDRAGWNYRMKQGDFAARYRQVAGQTSLLGGQANARELVVASSRYEQ